MLRIVFFWPLYISPKGRLRASRQSIDRRAEERRPLSDGLSKRRYDPVLIALSLPTVFAQGSPFRTLLGRKQVDPRAPRRYKSTNQSNLTNQTINEVEIEVEKMFPPLMVSSSEARVTNPRWQRLSSFIL